MENQTNPVNIINQENQKTPPLKSKILLVILIIIVILVIGIMVLCLSQPPVGSADLSWDSNTEANLAGYRIYYGETKRTGDCPASGYPDKIDVGNVISYKVSDLQPEKTYYFSITSYNTAQKESCFSTEVSKTIEKANWLQKIKYYFSINQI
ncbi:MAG: Fibronectin type III domain protein [Parcubacteria group bacterium GW2011_GWF2_44_7]|nr:MAG: Fibronectin type III domain protein [Parcubacteria group bacterium GW2011_GWF2_44_7]